MFISLKKEKLYWDRGARFLKLFKNLFLNFFINFKMPMISLAKSKISV